MEQDMLKVTTTRHDFLRERQGTMVADVLNDSEQSCDAVLDFFICGGRQGPVQDPETHHEQIPLAGEVQEFEAQPSIDDFFSSEHPHGTKRSRQAVGLAARLSMEHHGWKQTGTTSSLWAFEHRWPHLRDHAEGRNHRLPSE
jgi:hypothetical protein